MKTYLLKDTFIYFAGPLQHDLHFAEVSLIPHRECATSWGHLHRTYLCAGRLENGMGPCGGDSGGGLVCDIEGISSNNIKENGHSLLFVFIGFVVAVLACRKTSSTSCWYFWTTSFSLKKKRF